jgi:signal-transduction protein with cAMP-binding, CBS, and nucleotidyltransferase domain
VVGVVTDRDIAVRAVADGADPHTVSAASVAGAGPVTVAPGDTVGEAVTLMRKHAVRRLPVIEDGRPVGIVSLGDLAEEHSPTDEPQRRAGRVTRACETRHAALAPTRERAPCGYPHPHEAEIQ